MFYGAAAALVGVYSFLGDGLKGLGSGLLQIATGYVPISLAFIVLLVRNGSLPQVQFA